ncbi:MAG: outer membrane protein OmpA-like peptidoglycan-associated protein [Dokdonia sp.]
MSLSLFAQVDRGHETFFETDQYDLIKIEAAKLKRFISSLPIDKIEDISIYGYCDDRGTDAYNQALSQRRADAIQSIFMENGVSDSIITNADGKGELLLTRLDDAGSSVQRKLNRKVEIIVAIKVPRIVTAEVEESEKELEAVVKKRYKTLTDTIEKGDRILLENILFKTNYSYIKGKSHKHLRSLAKYLKENDNIIFKIQGHVCCIRKGRDAVDLKTGKRNLSVARAKFVYEYLANNGVAKKRMRYEGFGSRYPLGNETNMDKRVEILVTYVKKTKIRK